MDATIMTMSPGVWGHKLASADIEKRHNAKSVEHREEIHMIGVAPAKIDYTAMPDDQVMRAIAEGKRDALETLYDRYVNGCYGLALKIVRDTFVAEEIVQEVFLKLWTNPERYVPERGKFSGWVLTLVHNRSIDKLRRAKAGAQGNSLPIDLDNGTGVTLGDTIPDPSATPYEEAWRGEQGTLVRSALEMLPGPQREAISLAYFQGLTQREIAERLGEPLGTIKTRTRSGLLQLRRLLTRQGLTEDAA